ncbi:MAG TPA: O-antigen ligase [Candidatus Eremiobacteraceae bacterium]|nr:O-antigen ligase [Candidatus Eremiobacteraceae bacterium]
MHSLRNATEKFIAFGIALILSGALWRLLSKGTSQSLQAMEGDARTQVVLILIYATVAVLCLFEFRWTWHNIFRNPSLIALLILACASTAWADSSDIVIRRALGLVGTTLFGVYLGTRFSFDEQLRLLRWALRVAAAGTIALLILSPSRALSAPGGGGAYRGIFPHKNILGAAMALAFVVEWYVRDKRPASKVLRLISLCVYAALLVISDSLSSILTVAGILTVVWIVRILCRRHQIPIAAIAAFAMVFVLAVTITGVGSGDVLGLMGRSSDLTGRTELWSAVTEAIQEKPVLGYGFSGFWKDASPGSQIVEGQVHWTPTYSHNGYLEITLSLGFVGLALSVFLLGVGFRRAWKLSQASDFHLDSWPLAMLTFVAFHNLTECSIAWQNCLEWSVCVATIIGADPARQIVLEHYEELEESPSETGPELVI